MVAGGVKSSSVELSTANVLVNIMLSTAEIFIKGSPNWKELSSALPSGPKSFMKGININDQIFFFGNRMCMNKTNSSRIHILIYFRWRDFIVIFCIGYDCGI